MTAIVIDADLTLLTIEEAARAAHVPAGTIRRWIHEGRLPTWREGRRVWVPERELLDLEAALRSPGVDARRARLHAVP